MPYYVYVLKSVTTGKSYVGHSQDINNRIKEHTHGKSKSTRRSRPWRLAYAEEFSTRPEAVKRELYFKSIDGRKELKSMGLI